MCEKKNCVFSGLFWTSAAHLFCHYLSHTNEAAFETGSVPSSPPEHEFGVFVLHVLVHQLQQQRPHDVRIILQLSVQRHRQQGGEVTPSPGVEVRTTLQRADELEAENMVHLKKTHLYLGKKVHS